jgi:hypothetical protein
MMKSLSLPATLFFASSLFLAACGADEETTPESDTGVTPDTGGDDVSDTDATPGADTTPDASPDTTVESDTEPAVVPTFGDLKTTIFEPTCSGIGCHLNGGTSAPILDDADAYNTLLGFAEGADLNYVVPGNLEESYLWHKMKGTHRDVGGSGSAMPLGSTLSEEQIALLEAWILGGAPE